MKPLEYDPHSWGDSLRMATQGRSFASLCEDLLMNILNRLLLKDLARSSGVSKEWHRIISYFCVPRLSAMSPVSGVYFRLADVSMELRFTSGISTEHEKDQYKHQVAYDGDIHSINYVSLEALQKHSGTNDDDTSNDEVADFAGLLPFNPRGPDFLDCCNGLILCVQRSKPLFYVCNPAIRQCVPIPPPPSSINLPSLYASLAFDPSESIYYKVVMSSLTTQPQYLYIFSSKTGEWLTHEVQVELPASSQCFQLVRHSVYMKGVVYRLSLLNKIVCFDLNALRAYTINCPNKQLPQPQGCIGISNGGLSYAKVEDGYLRVWVLNNDKGHAEWNLMHEIIFDDLWNYVSRKIWYREIWLQPYGFHPKSNILFLGTARVLLIYDLGSGRLKTIKTVAWGYVHGGPYFSIFPYTQSFGTLKNWSKELSTEINACREVHDPWCYTEQ